MCVHWYTSVFGKYSLDMRALYVYTHTHTNTHTHTHTHRLLHTCMHTYIQSYIYAYIHAYIYTHTYFYYIPVQSYYTDTNIKSVQ